MDIAPPQETEVMPQAFAMEKQCTLREAEAFKAALLAAEDSSGDFVIHAGNVERIDTAALQLLAGFAARLRLVERRVIWSAVSEPLRKGAAQLDLATALGLDAPLESAA
jgi:anti-anti-sigma regulatory factor